jgi:hypothetical protein
VNQATRENLAQAELRQRIEELGAGAVRLARRVSLLA